MMTGPLRQRRQQEAVTLDDFPLRIVPGTYRVDEAERFGEKISIGTLKYGDFNPYENAHAVAAFLGGYGLRRYSDPSVSPQAILRGVSAEVSQEQYNTFYREAFDIDCSRGPAILAPLETVEVTGLAAPAIWMGEVTPTSGILTGLTKWVAVGGTKVVYRNSNGSWTDTGIVLPATARKGAVGVYNGALIIGFGTTAAAVFSTDLATTANVTNSALAPIWAYAITADQAALFLAGGPSAANWNTVTSGLSPVLMDTYLTPCGTTDSFITALAPGGGIGIVFVGKTDRLGIIDVNGVFRTLVPFDSQYSFNCFPGDTRVSWGAELQAISRRWYDGEIVEIITAEGHKLSGTPNHPVLTPRGWVALGLLNEGDDVVVDDGPVDKLPAADGNIDNVYPMLREVFEAAQKSGRLMWGVGRAGDFHGDGQNGDVDVVAPNGELTDDCIPPLSQSISNILFPPPDVNEASVSSQCASSQRSLCVVHSPASRLGLGPPRSSALRCSQPVSLRPRSGGNAQLSERPDDRPFRPAVVSRQLQGGHTLSVQASKLGNVIGEPATVMQGSRSQSQVSLPVRIVRISRRSFSGHVYNLQTKSNTYQANHITVHNCVGMRWALGSGGEEQRGALALVFPRDRSLWLYTPSGGGAGTAENISVWSKQGLRPPTIRGRTTSIQGTARWLYHCINNGTSGNSWLLKRDMLSGAVHSQNDLGVNLGDAMGVTSLFGSNPLLMVGSGNNAVSLILPLDGESPLDDPNTRYQPSGILDMPDIDLGFPDEQKIPFTIRVVADNLTPAGQQIEVWASLDGEPLTQLGIVENTPGGTVSFPSTVSANRIQIRFILKTIDPALTPQLLGFSLRVSINAKLYRIWRFQAALPGVRHQDGSEDRRNPKSMIDALWELRILGVPVAFVDRWGDQWTVRILKVSEAEIVREIDRVAESRMELTLLEFARGEGGTKWDDPIAIWDAPSSIWGSGGP